MGLGMEAGRAELGRLSAFMDIAAISAFPALHFFLLEDLALFNVI